jgi:acyl-CoA synthetase (AMP-forming)/AMP-acid ligase II
MDPATSSQDLMMEERKTFDSLWDLLQSSARNRLAQTAFHSCQQSPSHLSHLLPERENDENLDHLQWTYSQLLHAARTLGTTLQNAGLKPKSTFAVFCPNTVEWVVLFWACASIGVVFAPLNSRLVERPTELRHVLESLQPDAVAVFDPKCVPVLEKECGHIINMRDSSIKLFMSSAVDSVVEGWQRLQDLPVLGNKVYHPGTTLDDPIVMLLTSGTTSLPKLCPLTSRNIISQTEAFWTMRRLQPSSKLVTFGPGFHIQTIWNTIMAWRAGAAVVFPSATYDASAIVDALNSLPCTHLSCTPSIMFSLISQPHFSKDGYETLQSLALGAERVTKDLIERCYDAFKPKRVINGWGMTEGISILGADIEEPAVWREGTLSVGHVMPNSDIRICHPETMQIVGNDTVGELHVSGPTVISGYYSKGEQYRTDSFYQEDKKTWFKTGDSVVMDQQGHVYFEGRYKDLIVRGGENINPNVIEACLNKISGVEVSPDGMDD